MGTRDIISVRVLSLRLFTSWQFGSKNTFPSIGVDTYSCCNYHQLFWNVVMAPMVLISLFVFGDTEVWDALTKCYLVFVLGTIGLLLFDCDSYATC